MLSNKFLVSAIAGRKLALRQFHPNFKWPPPIKFRWEKNPVGDEAPATHWKAGNPDDPERFPEDAPYNMYPEKGDKHWPHHVYREPPPGMYAFYLDRILSKWLCGFMWFWVFYNLYYNYQRLTGHWYMPYLHEFTDEELGIPPDSAPDPTPEQYWGNHGKPYGTYR